MVQLMTFYNQNKHNAQIFWNETNQLLEIYIDLDYLNDSYLMWMQAHQKYRELCDAEFNNC